MARLPRFFVPGQPQHVIQRGNNRSTIFAQPADYRLYLSYLRDASQRYGCKVHGYVLMTNHTHLLITPENQTSLPKALQLASQRYVRYFNRRYQRTGTLWEGRYRATIIDSETYLLTCYRYIELNPVRAMMTKQPGDYPWSSYAHNALGIEDPLVTQHALYLALGQSPAERQQNYRSLFNHSISNQVLQDIRDATNKEWVLGNDRFKREIEQLTTRRVGPKQPGRPRRKN